MSLELIVPNALSNNSMDVRAKQRLCLLACPLNSELRVVGFAPRHLNRSAFRVATNISCGQDLIP